MNYLIPLNKSITNCLDSVNQNKDIVYNSQLESFVPSTIESFIPTPTPIPNHVSTKLIKHPENIKKIPEIVQRIAIIFILFLITIFVILLSYYVSIKYEI
jgi:hypothetical protein